MHARWTHTHVRGTPHTLRVALRSGTNGHGRLLGAVNYLPQSRKSMEEAERICVHIEQQALAHGYTILPDEELLES